MVDRSAQCRSSSTSSTGALSASSASMPSTAPNSCCCAMPGDSAPLAAAALRSGSSCPRIGRAARASSSEVGGWAGRGAAQRVGERQVGKAVTQLGAPPGQDREAALRGYAAELSSQARLADARVTADQGYDGLPGSGLIEQPQQAPQLRRPANEISGPTLKHPLIIPGGSDVSDAVPDRTARPAVPGRMMSGQGRPVRPLERGRSSSARSSRGPDRVVAAAEGRLADTIRVEGARILATLIRTAGSMPVARDAVQEAVLAALCDWPRSGCEPAAIRARCRWPAATAAPMIRASGSTWAPSTSTVGLAATPRAMARSVT